VEWYQGPWTWRGCFCDLSIVPNSPELDPTFKQFQWIGEIEHRHELWGQPGKIIATGFLSRGRMGRFDDSLNVAQLTDSTPDTSLVRRYGSRGGISLSVEQQVSSDLGLFARAGWADGNVEPYEFTDADRTVAAGLSLSGQRWGRPHDTFGLPASSMASRAYMLLISMPAASAFWLATDNCPIRAQKGSLRLYTASRSAPGGRLSIISSLRTQVITATAVRFRSSERGCTRSFEICHYWQKQPEQLWRKRNG
jgi:hypothetical protein